MTRRGVATVALLGLLLGAGWLVVGFSEAGAPEVPLHLVELSAFGRRITAEGNLEAAQATPITAPNDAPPPFKIAWVEKDGTRVSKGDVLVRFDSSDMEKSLADGESDRDRVDLDLAKSRAQSETARANLERDALEAEREYEMARDFRKRENDLYSRMEIVESELDEELSRRKRIHAETVREVRAELVGAEEELLHIERKKAELEIDKAQKGLQSLEVRAPHDGILVLTQNWRGETPQVGQTVWNGSPLGDIPDLSEMVAEVYVLEADAGGLTEGLPAEVTIEAHPQRTWRATVDHVDTLARPRMRGVPVQYFSVRLKLESTNPEVMKPGTRVQAVLILEQRDAAIVVPRQAVFRPEQGAPFVRRAREDGSFEKVEVVLGPASFGRVVVEEGLEPGDRIALVAPPDDGPEPTVTPPEEPE